MSQFMAHGVPGTHSLWFFVIDDTQSYQIILTT